MSPNKGGFTLIELMIVVVLIAIVGAIGTHNYVAMRDRKSAYNAKANAHAVQLLVEDWAVEHDGVYPNHIVGLEGTEELFNPYPNMPALADTLGFFPYRVVYVAKPDCRGYVIYTYGRERTGLNDDGIILTLTNNQ